MLFLTETVDNQQIDNIVNNNSTNLEKIFNFDWGLPSQIQTFLNKCIEVVAVILIFYNNLVIFSRRIIYLFFS